MQAGGSREGGPDRKEDADHWLQLLVANAHKIPTAEEYIRKTVAGPTRKYPRQSSRHELFRKNLPAVREDAILPVQKKDLPSGGCNPMISYGHQSATGSMERSGRFFSDHDTGTKTRHRHSNSNKFKQGGDEGSLLTATKLFREIMEKHFVGSILNGVHRARDNASYSFFLESVISIYNEQVKFASSSLDRTTGDPAQPSVTSLLLPEATGEPSNATNAKVRGTVPVCFGNAQTFFDFAFVTLATEMYEEIGAKLEELGLSPDISPQQATKSMEPAKLQMKAVINEATGTHVRYNGTNETVHLTLHAYVPLVERQSTAPMRKHLFVLLRSKDGSNEYLAIGYVTTVEYDTNGNKRYTNAKVHSDPQQRPVIYRKSTGTLQRNQDNWKEAELVKAEVCFKAVADSDQNRNGHWAWLINYREKDLPRTSRHVHRSNQDRTRFVAASFVFSRDTVIDVYPLAYNGSTNQLRSAYLLRHKHQPDPNVLLSPSASHFRPPPLSAHQQHESEYLEVMALLSAFLPPGLILSAEQERILRALHSNLVRHRMEMDLSKFRDSSEAVGYYPPTRCLFVQGPAGSGKTVLFAIMICFAIVWALRRAKAEEVNNKEEEANNNSRKTGEKHAAGELKKAEDSAASSKSKSVKVVFACATHRAANELIIKIQQLGLVKLLSEQAKESGLAYTDPEINYPMVRLGHESDIRSTVVFQFTPLALASSHYIRTGQHLPFHSSVLVEDCLLAVSTLSNLSRGGAASVFMEDAPENPELAEVLLLLSDEVGMASIISLSQLFQFRSSVLVFGGDKMQLQVANVTDFAIRCNVNHSLFELVDGIKDGNNDPSQLYLWLKTQYRMHLHVAHFLVHHFYKGSVINGYNLQSEEAARFGDLNRVLYFNVIDGEEQAAKRTYSPEQHGKDALVLPQPGEVVTFANNAEYKLAAVLVRYFLRRLKYFPYQPEDKRDPVKLAKEAKRIFEKDNFTICAITFYVGQRNRLRAEVEKLLGPKYYAALLSAGVLTVETIDSVQGQEFSISIQSFVRAADGEGVGFLQVPGRLATGISRGKDVTVHIGNVANFLHAPSQLVEHFQRLSADATERGHLVTTVSLPDDEDLDRQICRFSFFSRYLATAGQADETRIGERIIEHAAITCYRNRLNFHVAEASETEEKEEEESGNIAEMVSAGWPPASRSARLPATLSTFDLYGLTDAKGVFRRVRLLPRNSDGAENMSDDKTAPPKVDAKIETLRCVDTGRKMEKVCLHQLVKLENAVRNAPIGAIHCCIYLEQILEYYPSPKTIGRGHGDKSSKRRRIKLLDSDTFNTGTESPQNRLFPEKHLWPVLFPPLAPPPSSRPLSGEKLRARFFELFRLECLLNDRSSKWYLDITRWKDEITAKFRKCASAIEGMSSSHWAASSSSLNPSACRKFLRVYLAAQEDKLLSLLCNLSEHYIDTDEFVPTAFQLGDEIAFRFGGLFLRGLVIYPSAPPQYWCLAVDLALCVLVHHTDIRHLHPMFNLFRQPYFVPRLERNERG